MPLAISGLGGGDPPPCGVVGVVLVNVWCGVPHTPQGAFCFFAFFRDLAYFFNRLRITADCRENKTKLSNFEASIDSSLHVNGKKKR